MKPSEMILADEPTGSLDVDNRNDIMHILKELNNVGQTIIIVTHDQYVASICNKIIDLAELMDGETEMFMTLGR